MTNKLWYERSTPDEVQPIPWLHPEATEFFEFILEPDFRVLEHGAGGSTLWLSERVDQVDSVEHDIDWRLKMRELCPANVIMLDRIPPPSSLIYDLCFIDGKREERGPCILAAEKLVRPGGWVVLDNSNRPEYAAERRRLYKFADLKERYDNNIANSLYFVTEFWQCLE